MAALLVAFVAVGLFGLRVSRSAPAETLKDVTQELTVNVGAPSGGKAAVSIDWSLDPQWGDPENPCASETEYTGQVELMREEGGSEVPVTSWSISSQSGSGRISLPSGEGASHSYIAWAKFHVHRQDICGAERNAWETEDADRYANLNFTVPYEERPSTTTASECSFTVTYEKGDAGVETATQSSPLKPGESVSSGQTLSTGPGAGLELADAYGVLRIGPSSRVFLQHGYCGPVHPRWTLKLILGRLWTKLTNLTGKPDAIRFETENSVVGSRGTTFTVAAFGAGARCLTTVSVAQGLVAVSSRFHRNHSVLVHAHRATRVRGRGEPSRPR